MFLSGGLYSACHCERLEIKSIKMEGQRAEGAGGGWVQEKENSELHIRDRGEA